MKFRQCLPTIMISMACSMANAGSLWMTDGSQVDFHDTVEIEEAQVPADLFDSYPYEGAIDQDLVFGTYQLPVDKKAYLSVEAEWVLILPNNTHEVDLDTPVTLQGMIDGKYFSEFRYDQYNWQPASIGNNLVASGVGIETSIREILAGEVDANIDLHYKDVWGRTQSFSSNSLSLKDLPLIELVNGVLLREPSAQYINLGAVEASSAFVNDEAIRAAAIVKSVIELPISGLPLNLDSLTRLTLKHISKIIIHHGKYMRSNAVMTVTDGNGEEVGSGYLSLQ